MDYRAGSQSTLTKSTMPPQMMPPQMMDQHLQMMKMSNGSPRNFNSMERSYSNTSTIPQAPPHYTPYQYGNSLQRNSGAGAPLQIQAGHPGMQVHHQMSMPAPTPPPPYGGSLAAHHLNGSMNPMASNLPSHQSGSMQFPPPQNSAAAYQMEMQYNAAQAAAQNQFMPTPLQQQQMFAQQSGTLPTPAPIAGSVQSVNSSVRSRSKSRGKQMVLRVLLLDGTTPRFEVPNKSLGQDFFHKVVEHLSLLETDYFGLQYAADHAGSVYWLEMQKPVNKQVKGPSGILFRFAVKFYTPDPGQLQDEYTKVLFALQIKRDMACGMLPCAENTAALMASYIVQAELGDFDLEKNGVDSPRYLSMFKFIPPQTDEFLGKVMEYHRNHIGQSPADADYNLLDIARRLEMYGIRLHPARDHESVLVHIAVNHQGIIVFQHFQKISTFSWSKVRKVSFKKKVFYIKLLSDAVAAYNREFVEYHMTSRNACKRFWKDCVEHHAFFRLPENQHAAKPPPAKIIHGGSSYRYGGRSQREMSEQVRNNNQARLQVRRPGSNMGVPFSRTLPAKPFGQIEAQQANTMAGMSSVHSMQPGPPRRPELSPEFMQQQQHMTQPGMLHQQQPGASMVAVPPMNSRASPLPVQQHHFTPLLNQRSGTPSMEQNRPPSLQPQMFSPLNPVSPGSPNSPGFPPLPSHMPRGMNVPQVPDSQPDMQDGNESDHDYENYPIPEDIQRSMNGHQRDSFAEDLRQQQQFPHFGSQQMQQGHHSNAGTVGFSMDSHSVESDRSHDSAHITQEEQPALNHPNPSHQLQQLGQFANPRVQSPPAGGHPHPMSPQLHDVPSRPPPDLRPHLTQEVLLNAQAAHPQVQRLRRDSENSSSVAGPGGGRLDDDIKRRKVISAKSYYVTKEIVNTERTYIKDLEVIANGFQKAVAASNVSPALNSNFFHSFGQMVEEHTEFLRELEKRLKVWEGGKSNVVPLKDDCQRVGDIMVRLIKSITPIYESFLSRQNTMMMELQEKLKNVKSFETAFKKFEQHKICYLPFTSFLLKPSQRLLHYELLLNKLLAFYPVEHTDHAECKEAHEYLVPLIQLTNAHLVQMEHSQKLAELQRDLCGVGELVSTDRKLVREGSLHMQSPQDDTFNQRMFFLFSDVLLYTSGQILASNQFLVEGKIELYRCRINEDVESEFAARTFGLIIEDDDGSEGQIVLAASSETEKELWLQDLDDAISECQARVEQGQPPCTDTISLHPEKSGEDGSTGDAETQESEEEGGANTTGSSDKVSYHRSNNTMHVCWHRNTSVSMNDHIKSVHNQLSGYLLRKFKNSNGWQKLWVVFTNFCLFFYKTHDEDSPLASLPLLGYSITLPDESDSIEKPYAFKLTFKTHVYFFRAESEYSFNRWLEVIGCATNS